MKEHNRIFANLRKRVDEIFAKKKKMKDKLLELQLTWNMSQQPV